MYPGDYPILQKDEKILDLIERAGGLTPYAFIQSAKLYRLDKTIGTVVIDLEEAFRSPDFERLKSQLNEAVIFDGRNIYEPTNMTDLGFAYFGIGRSNQ